MIVPDTKRLKDVEAETKLLKKLLAKQVFENDGIKDALQEGWWPHQRVGCWCGAWSTAG